VAILSLMFWQRLHTEDQPLGFPAQTSALASVQLWGKEVLVAVGGEPCESRYQRQGRGAEIDELCLGRGEAPVDVWSTSLQQPVTSEQSDPVLEPFHRSVLAFPPRPRCSFSLTALDGEGRRLLLFGGHSGQRCRASGHYLADAHVLEFNNSACADTPSCSSSESEPDRIFFRNEYKVRVAGQRAPPPEVKPCTVGLANQVLKKGRQSGGLCCESSSENDESSDDESSCPSRPHTGGAMPQTMADVMQQLGASTKLKFRPREGRSNAGKDQGKKRSRLKLGRIDDAVRWRVPQVQNGVHLCPRAGHSAVLRAPLTDGTTASVLIFGGVGTAGVPLGDVWEMAISETENQCLQLTWSCLDEGNSGRCNELAPWDQQDRPRPRVHHTAMLWHNSGSLQGCNGCMVIFGGLGLGLEGEPRALGDTWLLLTGSAGSDNSRAVCWKRPLMKGGAPARRWGHSACLVGGVQGAAAMMLLCGGVDYSGRKLSDCWVLDLDDMRWEAVEEMVPHLSIRRAPLTPSAAAASLPAALPELGCCNVLWSTSEDMAIVWGGGDFWAWHEPGALRIYRAERAEAAERQQREQHSMEEASCGQQRNDGKARRQRRHRRRNKDKAWADAAQSPAKVEDIDEEVVIARPAEEELRHSSTPPSRWSPASPDRAFSPYLAKPRGRPAKLPVADCAMSPASLGMQVSVPGGREALLPEVLPPTRRRHISEAPDCGGWGQTPPRPRALHRMQSEPTFHQSWPPQRSIRHDIGSSPNRYAGSTDQPLRIGSGVR